jgi:NDP-sugar pyrophosphorylase family protein
MQLVILAGGIASRMKPLSDGVPKSLFVVAGRPFLDWQLELCASRGATEVLLLVAHLADQIRTHLAATHTPLPVVVADDGDARLGTGGALVAAARRELLAERFLVTYGDSYLPVDLTALWHAHRGPATMAVHENGNRWDGSNAIVAGDRVVRYEKIGDASARPPAMRWIDFGLLALDRDEVLAWKDAAPFDLAAPLGRLAAAGNLHAFCCSERFYEIGSAAGLAELEGLLSA